ncbi:MAG TPA: hypothetical protein VGP80_16820 [Gemmatimonadales bacterium]|nr:hypothetical protein [Gemmatimonadales bacterium]
MTTHQSDSPTPVPTPKKAPTLRSEALEAELAMLEAILPPEAESAPPPAKVDAPTDRGETR